jgi:UDP-glucose 6-dehydrogenase
MCKKCEDTRSLLLELANRQGHDRCWWNPEILQQLFAIHEIVVPSPILPTESEFREGCNTFTEELYQRMRDGKDILKDYSGLR